ncbi:hypothetical protein RhiirA5_403092 [Rhizophagus irregularis]|uniref:Uncharacterized protein n=1 Tax=Rhizophagus irregularis TaxID=588596 RepID=A0A2N0P1Y5_9GLOM|nr:hypothetical protein RhiirA5_403092 [Rhizophagus irregularis]
MEVKNYNFVYQNVEDLEKIDDNESVKDDDESTEDNKSDIDYNRKPKKYKIRNSRKINRLTKTIDEAGRKIIIDHMDEWLKRGRKPSNVFKELVKKLKNSCGQDYDSKALCHLIELTFIVLLVDRSSFSPEEEHYICELVVEYQRTNKALFHGRIFNLSIKNVWYAGQRRNDRLAIFERGEFNTIKDKFEIEDKDKIEYNNEIEDKNLIDNNGEIEDKGEIKYENEFEGVPEKLHQLAFSVNKIEPSTNQEKLKFRYLLNDDENDNDIL